MAGATELSCAMKGFQHLGLMEGWFCLDHQFIERLQQLVLAVRKRIMMWLVDRVVCISNVGINGLASLRTSRQI